VFLDSKLRSSYNESVITDWDTGVITLKILLMGWVSCIVRDVLYLTFGSFVIILFVAIRCHFFGWLLDVAIKKLGKKRQEDDSVVSSSEKE